MLVLMAVLLPCLVGLAALLVDVGYLYSVKAELQATADAAALAGANGLSVSKTEAMNRAAEYVQKNPVNGTTVALQPSDVQLGLWDSTTRTFTALGGSSNATPTAVKVTLQLSQVRKTGVLLFFANIFGTSSADVGATATATNGPVYIKLTTNSLGLGSTDLNSGSVKSADVPGKFITSKTTGQGSILSVQRSGLAGPGTASDPLLCTITAHTHLDTVSGLPVPNDYQAGIIYMTAESSTLPDGANEGLGVRAYTCASNALRTFSGGLEAIEGSKEISGGTGPTAWNPSTPNGAPHVDEDILFTFANPVGSGIVVTLSEVPTGGKINLDVYIAGGGHLTKAAIGPPGLGWSSLGNSVWNLDISQLGLVGSDASFSVQSFSIRAIDNNPASPKGTAEHFLIAGFKVSSPPLMLVK